MTREKEEVGKEVHCMVRIHEGLSAVERTLKRQGKREGFLNNIRGESLLPTHRDIKGGAKRRREEMEVLGMVEVPSGNVVSASARRGGALYKYPNQ